MPAASATDRPGSARGAGPSGAPYTLAVDIGGTYLKAAVLDAAGATAAERIKRPTPKPATPDAVIAHIADIAAGFPAFDRISVGFPGVVRRGTVETAPNLGTPYWTGFRLIEALAARFGTPARLLNDAAVQGLGVVEGRGLECVLTLGTGVGCALFRQRRLLLHLEFGQLRRADELNYDGFIGQAALEAVGPDLWNVRVRDSIETVIGLTNCDTLYIGGGNARRIAFELPPEARLVSNAAGVTGGVRLWEAQMDEFFVGEINAQWPRVTEGRP